MASGAALPSFTVLGAGSPQSCRQDSHRCGGKRRGRCAHGRPDAGPPVHGSPAAPGWPRRSPDDGVRPLSLHDVTKDLDDGVVRHTARPAVCVPLHHAVGALAQMRVLHILDALQLRHHLGRIHQLSSERREFCCTAAKDARKMEHAVGAAESIWCTSSASSRPSARSRRRRSPEPLLAKCKASGIFSSSFRSVSLLYWSHTKKHTAEVLPFSAGKS